MREGVPEAVWLDIRKRQRVPDQPSGHAERRMPRRHGSRLSAMEPTDGFESPLYDERGDQGADGCCRLSRGGLWTGRRCNVLRAIAGPGSIQSTNPCAGYLCGVRALIKLQSRAGGRHSIAQSITTRRRRDSVKCLTAAFGTRPVEGNSDLTLAARSNPR